MRQLATIRTIADIRPIPGADRIEIAQIDGWECVVSKSDGFNIGDSVVYIEVDSILPERPEFEFMRDRKFRVRTIRLMKQVSQGLVLPMTILPSSKYKLGDDVTDILGITKYDPQAQLEAALLRDKAQHETNPIIKFLMRFKCFRKLYVKPKRGAFPTWIVKTDEERIQNKMSMFEVEKKNGTTFMTTEKIDGQSATYYLQKVNKKKCEFGVCSRNIHLTKPDSSSYWTIALKLGIENALKDIIGDYDRIVLQGEIIGPGIQKNKYGLQDYDFYAFNLIFPDRKLDTREMAMILAPHKIKTVPVVDDAKAMPETIAELVEYAKGNSVVLGKQKREGIVMRNKERNISFKVINPDFLLTNDE